MRWRAVVGSSWPFRELSQITYVVGWSVKGLGILILVSTYRQIFVRSSYFLHQLRHNIMAYLNYKFKLKPGENMLVDFSH